MDFEKLFTDYKVDYTTKRNKGWVNVECPFCSSSSHKKHLGFNIKGDYCFCWKCGVKKFKTALSRVLNIPSNFINDVIKNYNDATFHNSSDKGIKQRVKCLELPSNTFTLDERKYLKERGFNPSYLYKKYGVVGGGIVGKWKFRVIIPLYVNGKVVTWVARSILSKDKIKEYDIPRYLNLSAEESVISSKETWFNLDHCYNDWVVITEGAFDVMRFGDNCVCSLGTITTEEQINIIKDRFKKVYILFDNEVEAQDKARKLGYKLTSVGVECEVINAFADFNKNDMGECNQEEINIIKKEIGVL